MDIIELREFCLSFEGVIEKMPFGKFAARYDSILVFYVMDHMFCLVDIDSFNYVCLKSPPEVIENMRLTRSSVGFATNMSRKYWMSIEFGGDIPDSEIYDLIRRSYVIVKEKYSPRKSTGRRKK